VPVCTQSEKRRLVLPRYFTDPEDLIPVKASNCPSVEECKKCMGIFESIDSAKELATREEDTVGHARFSESISVPIESR
jgi:hypothetical protein